MKKMSLVFVILLAALVAAAQGLDDYPINVHVSSARTIMGPAGSSGFLPYEQLDVTINGKKYELRAPSDGSLLKLGDYNARLAQDQHKTPYESLQVYEFLFSDGKMVKFAVTGQTE